MGASSRVGLAKPMHLIVQVWGVEIPKPGEGLVARPGEAQVADTGQDVDDWLGLKSRDRGATDVVDPTHDPGADGLCQSLSLKFKAPRPAVVVLAYLNRLIDPNRRRLC